MCRLMHLETRKLEPFAQQMSFSVSAERFQLIFAFLYLGKNTY